MSNVSKVQLKDLAVEMYQGINTVADKVKYYDEGIKILQAKHITKGYIDFSDARNISPEDYNKYKEKYQPKINDILLSNIGTIGKSILVEEEQQYVIAWNIFMIRLKESVYARYINYYFQRLEKINYYEKFMTGNATKFINKTTMSEIEFLLPPLKEQKKIAEILSSVDAAIEKTEQVIAKTEEVKKGLMQQLLTKGIRHTEFKQTEIGEIPVEWSVKRIKDLVSFSGGAQPPRKEFVFEPREGYIRLIQIRDYKNDKYATYIPKELAKKLCDATDIMIGRYGPPIFQILRGIEGAYNVALIKAIPDEIYLNKDYLYYFLQRQDLFNLIDHLSQRSSGQTGIDMEALNNFGFPLPQLEEQMEIVKIIRNIENKIHTEKIKYSKLNAVKTGLMQQLLTGKTRVKEATMCSFLKELGYCE